MKSILLFIVIIALVRANSSDEMRFPDWPSAYNFSKYSGMFDITPLRKLHYVFLES